MIQPLNPAFFGKVVPLAGERKPPSASRHAAGVAGI
jgi:hypothetical protein